MHMVMRTRTHRHKHTHTVAVASETSLVRSRCQKQAEQWNTGSLVPDFGDSCLSPDLASKYTAASGNSTLSSREARHGKFRRNTKDVGEEEGGSKKKREVG